MFLCCMTRDTGKKEDLTGGRRRRRSSSKSARRESKAKLGKPLMRKSISPDRQNMHNIFTSSLTYIEGLVGKRQQANGILISRNVQVNPSTATVEPSYDEPNDEEEENMTDGHQRRIYELKMFKKYKDSNEDEFCLFIIDAQWVRFWVSYVVEKSSIPPEIMNDTLFSQITRNKTVKMGKDYLVVGSKLWDFFHCRYGGGPRLKWALREERPRWSMSN